MNQIPNIEKLLVDAKPKSLPNKPSELIALALHDLELAEKSDDYDINMYCWHAPDSRSRKCSVCLAGAVLAFSLGYPKYSPWDEDKPMREKSKMFALDRLRCGSIYDGLIYLGIRHPEGMINSMHVTPYEINPRLFKRDMMTIVTKLQENGL